MRTHHVVWLPVGLLCTLVFCIASATTLCAFPTNEELTQAVVAARYASTYYASQFSAAGPWEFQLLGNGDTGSRNIVMSYVRGGLGTCDAIIGAGYSDMDIALSPVVDVPWMDFWASRPALSDKSQHPFFSRVINHDGQFAAAVVSFLRSAKWLHVSFIGLDTAYGQGYGTAFSAALVEAGGKLHQYRSVPSDIDRESIKRVFDAVQAGESRVVFLVLDPASPLVHTVAVIKERRLDERMIFVFAEWACSGSQNLISQLKSAFCLMMEPRDDGAADFVASYAARDATAERQLLRTMGIAAGEKINYTATNLLTTLAHDATHHVMAALDQNARRASPLAGLPLVEFMRNVTSVGGSGTVSFLPNGERRESEYVVVNVVRGAERRVAKVSGPDRVVHLVHPNGEVAGTSVPMQIMGQMTEVFPSPLFPPVQPAASGPDTTVIAVCTSAGVAIFAAAVVVGVLCCRSRGRDHRHAPQDPSKPFAMVFTDIQASTALWARAPELMSVAVGQHHDIIRAAIAAHSGYEVKTVGDAFMVAFKDPSNALRFSLDLQVRLHRNAWGTDVFDDTYTELLAEEDTVHATGTLYKQLWNGLRVRVGVHYGVGCVLRDPVTRSFDYYGTVVNTAARVEAVSHGGQVCLTQALAEAVGGFDDLPSQFEATTIEFGPQPLKGLEERVWMAQALPEAFRARQFPPLRLSRDFGCSVASSDGFCPLLASSQPQSKRGSQVSALSHWSGSAGVTDCAIATQFAPVDGLLAPLPPRSRATVIATLAAHWRIGGRLKATALAADPHALSELLQALKRKAAPAVIHRQQQPEGFAPAQITEIQSDGFATLQMTAKQKLTVTTPVDCFNEDV